MHVCVLRLYWSVLLLFDIDRVLLLFDSVLYCDRVLIVEIVYFVYRYKRVYDFNLLQYGD